jgi:hypothetical protein
MTPLRQRMLDAMTVRVYIDTGHAPQYGRKSFHRDAPLCTMNSGRQGEHLNRHPGIKPDTPMSCKTPRIDNRFGPLYRSCCRTAHDNGPHSATVGGASQLGGGPIRRRGRAFIRNATSFAQCATPYLASGGFHRRGRAPKLMYG